eukprot:scaffold317033_cov22-Tisochrysis_lutea.AAC.1
MRVGVRSSRTRQTRVRANPRRMVIFGVPDKPAATLSASRPHLAARRAFVVATAQRVFHRAAPNRQRLDGCP